MRWTLGVALLCLLGSCSVEPDDPRRFVQASVSRCDFQERGFLEGPTSISVWVTVRRPLAWVDVEVGIRALGGYTGEGRERAEHNEPLDTVRIDALVPGETYRAKVRTKDAIPIVNFMGCYGKVLGAELAD